jgi:hypothetical protein
MKNILKRNKKTEVTVQDREIKQSNSSAETNFANPVPIVKEMSRFARASNFLAEFDATGMEPIIESGRLKSTLKAIHEDDETVYENGVEMEEVQTRFGSMWQPKEKPTFTKEEQEQINKEIAEGKAEEKKVKHQLADFLPNHVTAFTDPEHLKKALEMSTTVKLKLEWK